MSILLPEVEVGDRVFLVHPQAIMVFTIRRI